MSNEEQVKPESQVDETNAEQNSEVETVTGEVLAEETAAIENHSSELVAELEKKLAAAEAKVIEHYPGKGKYKGLLGAMLVETLDSAREKIRFRIGTGFSDEERSMPPPIGSLITYKYFGYTKLGLPKFPSFIRIRRE